MRIFFRFLFLLVSVLLFALYGYRAAYPGFHVDEGLYAGAASAVLNGDWLLSHYWVEKPPLPFYLMAFSALVLGENILGFHFAGLIFSVLAFFFLISWIRHLVVGDLLLNYLFLFVCLAVFVSPVYLQHGPTSFMEPFQLLFLLLFGISLKRKGCWEKKAYFFLMAALLCKQTTILYFPMLMGYWIIDDGFSLRLIKKRSRDFFVKTRFFWVILILALFTYKQKFSLISTFQLNVASEIHKAYFPQLLERAGIWFSLLHLVFRSGLGSALFLLSCLVGSVFCFTELRKGGTRAKERSLREIVWCYVIPFWIHLGALCLLPVRTYERYLYILVPQGLALLAVTAHYLRGQRTLTGKAVLGVLCGALVLLTIHCLVGFRIDFNSFDLTPPEFTEATEQILEEVPKDSLINTDSLWLTQPFQHGHRVHLVSCTSDDCFTESTMGLAKPIPREFLLLRWKTPNLPKAEPNLLYQRDRIKNDWEECSVPPERLLETRFWYERLRMKSSGADIKIVTNSKEVPKLVKGIQGWNEIPSLEGQIQLTLGKPFLFKRVVLHGVFRIARHHRSLKFPTLEKDMLGFRIKRISVDDGTYDFSPLAPLFWGGHFIPLFGVACGSF